MRFPEKSAVAIVLQLASILEVNVKCLIKYCIKKYDFSVKALHDKQNKIFRLFLHLVMLLYVLEWFLPKCRIFLYYTFTRTKVINVKQLSLVSSLAPWNNEHTFLCEVLEKEHLCTAHLHAICFSLQSARTHFRMKHKRVWFWFISHC